MPRRVADHERLVLGPAQKPGREAISRRVLAPREDLPQVISRYCVLVSVVIPDRVDGLAVGSGGGRDVALVLQTALDLKTADAGLDEFRDII